MSALNASAVASGYGELQILRDLSLQVQPGQIVTVVGPNGAGKSTLMATIAGVRPLWRGTITFRGRDVSHESSAARMKAGLGWVPEGRNIFGHLTVRDNLYLSCYMAGMKKRFKELEAQVLAEFPILEQYHGIKASALSGGQAQILALARVLVREPTVVLLDEPTIGLSPAIVSVLGEAIAARALQGMSWLVAEQNVGWLADLSGAVYVMLGGRIVSTGGGELLRDRDRLGEIYFGLDPPGASTARPVVSRTDAARLQR